MIVVGSTMKNSIQIELKKSLMNIRKLIYTPKRRPLEDLEVFEDQLAKESMKEYSEQEVSTHDHKESTHEDSEQKFESGNKCVNTWL